MAITPSCTLRPSKDWTHVPLVAREPRPEDAALVPLIRALRLAWERGDMPDAWLPFPQTHANIGYGPEARPLPIGALRLMWAARYPFVQACPACEHGAWMVSAGGHPTMGGLDLVCLACTTRWHQPIGGLYRVVEAINLRALDGSAFEAVGPQPLGSDGLALRKSLGLPHASG